MLAAGLALQSNPGFLLGFEFRVRVLGAVANVDNDRFVGGIRYIIHANADSESFDLLFYTNSHMYLSELYQVLESKSEHFAPNSSSYAIMLLFHRFGPKSINYLQDVRIPYPSDLLKSIIKRNIPIATVVSDRALENREEAIAIIKYLSSTAVDLDNVEVISELGQAQTLGANRPDVLDDVPEARPAIKVVPTEDAETSTTQIPFNINNLRQHLVYITMARRVLPDDVIARQEHLEKSAYEVAIEKMEHQARIFEDW
ncbi:hypothetical protein H0H93_005580 [Arthromyces matolae]|nr:hypothetical protein H0H93_005580 [Arthromyces matolae]